MKICLPLHSSVFNLLFTSKQTIFPSDVSSLPWCKEFRVQLSVSSDNWDLSRFNWDFSIPEDPAINHGSETFNIFFKYCEPIQALKRDAIIVTHHGVMYTHEAFDIGYEPEKYSVTRHAVSQGYAVLLYDRLGEISFPSEQSLPP
jgi:hypothetical protein